MNHNETEEHAVRRRSSPGKRRKNSKSLYYIILAVLLAILVFSGWKIISYLSQQKSNEDMQQAVIDEFVVTEDIIANTGDDASSEGDDKSQTKKEVVIQPDQITDIKWDDLKAKYPDVIGYIYCANTGISYPFVQSSSNDYYLNHGVDGKENVNGSIFMEYLNSSSFSDGNTIIYGHNMKNGSMFAPLQKYNSMGQSYYEAHPYMYIYTPDQNYRLDLFAGCQVPHDADIYSLSVSQDTLASYVSASTFKSSTGVPTGKIVTLSTCSYEVSNGRYVVLGELVPIN